MERFPSYKGDVYVAKKMATDVGLKMRSSEDIVEMVSEMARRMRELSEHDPGIVSAALEMIHYTASHKVVCVTKDLAESLMDTNMNEINIEHLRLPFHLFELCIERGTSIPDVDDVPGMLICIAPDETTTNVIIKSLSRMNMFINGGAEHVQSMFRMVWAHSLIKHQNNVDLRTVRNKTIDEVIRELPAFKVGVPLNDQEKKESASLMRLVMGVLCYLNVKEPDVTEFKNRQRTQLGEKPNCLLLGGGFKKSPSWHMRRAHFRILRDERYRRDDEGKPKVVWIREAEVNPE